MAGSEKSEKNTEKNNEIGGEPAEAMLEMILRKEEETKSRIEQAKTDAQRMVEEAKMDAANEKRKAVSEEIGADLRKEKLADADRQAVEIVEQSKVEAERIRQKGEEQVKEAVDIVIRRVLPSTD